MPCFFMPVWVLYGFLSAPIPSDLIPTSATLRPLHDGAGPFFHALPAPSGGYNRLLPFGIGKHTGTHQTPPCGPPGATSQILVKCPFSPGLTAPLSGSESPHRRGAGFTVPFPPRSMQGERKKACTKKPCVTAYQRRALAVRRDRTQRSPPSWLDSSDRIHAERPQDGPQERSNGFGV